MDEIKTFNIQIKATDTAKYALLGKCQELGITIVKDREYKPNPEMAARMRAARTGRV